MKYFTIKELSRTSQPIDNTPSSHDVDNLVALVTNVLDPIRELWGKPITVNSGYRNPVVNRAVGGAATSQHTKGEAVDISAGSPSANQQLFDMIVKSGIVTDQLIDEKNYKWIHVSYKRAGANRNQILHLK